MVDVRKGQAPGTMSREDFGARYRMSFVDPAFDGEREAIARLEEIAWKAYREERKAPVTRAAGPGYADPTYELAVDWLRARAAVDEAAARWKSATTPSRVLVVCSSPRNDGTCPGEMSKTFRMTDWISDELS